jgi:acetylornithine/N-succinyldiaminopimelate aminotransferase
MAGMELLGEGEPVVSALRERRILINCTDQTVLRFVPPLIIQREHVDLTTTALREVLADQN